MSGKATLEYLLKAIVDHPEEIQIEEYSFPYAVSYEVTLNEEDKGIVIGKRGKTIQSINKVLSALQSEKTLSVDIK